MEQERLVFCRALCHASAIQPSGERTLAVLCAVLILRLIELSVIMSLHTLMQKGESSVCVNENMLKIFRKS